MSAACQQPGCTGSIVDGYCDVCGSPGSGGTTTGAHTASVDGASPAAATMTSRRGPIPMGSGRGATASATSAGSASAPPSGVARPPARSAPSVAPRSAASASVPNGTPCTQPGCTGRIQTGYCDVCGSPAGARSSSPVDDDAALSTLTRGSTTLQSMALGTRRAGSDSTASRRVGLHSTRMRSARLGAGLTRVPPAPPVDPSAAIMKHPVVPENKRHCPSCGAEVGRSRDGVPGRTTGFCARCRNPFSFDPKLQPGDLVAGQYEVRGCLAHGGLGWIYLAQDKNVSDRWVVLKGLLNAGDADAMNAAIAEQQFLAQVEHPLIVEIYNFVTHEEAGYTVMEYVGGTSLKQLLKQRMEANNGEYSALPPAQALAFVIEALPAFQYLHDMGLLYCDFKPDNLIQIGDGIKLIDLGGVRRIDDDESAIYGTVGYQAPEVATMGPSIASDVYTIGRTLVVLIAEFRGYQSRWVGSLPGPDVLPIFAEHDSLYRLLLKCCAADPADRFTSADELRTQLIGVLREIVAAETEGTGLTSAASVLFEAPAITTSILSWDQLPRLRPDTADPQFAWLSNLAADDPAERLRMLLRAPEQSAEIRLARAAAAMRLGRSEEVQRVTDEMLRIDPWEWRALWMSGLAALQRQDWPTAQAAFNAVYGQVPGELAPKLALAVACEYGDQRLVAEGLYRVCASTDSNYVAAAAFGMARIRQHRGDLDGAIEALDLIPETSRAYAESRRFRASVMLARSGSGLPTLSEAMSVIDSVRLDPIERQQFTERILTAALATVRQGGDQPRVRIGQHAATEASLRDALEQTYRDLSRSVAEPERRVFYVDQANTIRRWTLR